ncbi:MAG TPA: peptidase S41, partial [Pseudonocardia sp.]|nr:peptidase S41 [Pseudonocardia sp.]
MTTAPSYLRFPHLRGSSLVFVAEDDIWLAPVAGGRAFRLSADRAPAANPRLSADGSRVAWTSRRDGPFEVYVADVEGGQPSRLTYWGDNHTRTVGWVDEGDEVLAVTPAADATDNSWAYALPAAGGPARRLPYGPVSDLALGAGDRALLCSVISVEPAWWKRYRGGTAGKLWWNADGEFTRLLPDLPGHIVSPMLVGDRIAFLSDHEGWGNIYSVALDRPDDSDLRRHTDHGTVLDPGAGDPPPFYARHATTDGTRIVYQCAGQLWLLDSLDSTARPLDIRLGGPRTARVPYRITTERFLNSAVPDTSGRVSVVGVRGTVHRLAHRDGPARTLSARPGVRARLARPLGGDTAAWITDADGEDALELAPLDTQPAETLQTRRYGAGEIGRVLELACAPDGSRVALASHDGRLLIFDTEAATFTELARGADGEVSGLAFAPDSAWLAWSDPVEAGVRRILIARLAEDPPIPIAVTPTRFVDTSPVFTTDGKYLAFLSYRSFDPV